MAVVTIDEVKNYLGIDYSDTMVDANINRLINTADAYLKGSIGQDYPVQDPRSKELALIIIGDLYDNRMVSQQITMKTRKLVDDMSLQLRLEMRRCHACD